MTADKDVIDNQAKRSRKKRLKASDYRDREYLHVEEINRLLVAAKREREDSNQEKYPYCWDVLLLLMYRHALRVSEAIALKWTDIDWTNGRISVHRKKGSISGIQPLSADELRGLKRLFKAKTSSYIFISSQGKPVADISVRKCIERLGRKADLPFSLHPHMIRHSAAIHFLDKTNNLYLTKEFLGHKEIDNTLLYLKLVPGMLENAGWFR